MEEVDNIIIHSLRITGCEIDDDVESLKQFNTELIVEACVRCLKVINSDTDLPNGLPPGMSARFRVGTSLATIIQELGYRGDIGYQTFLYWNEADIRKVFMFLVEKLPKEAIDTTEEPLGSSILMQRAIASVVARQLKSPWIPPVLKDGGITWRGKPVTWQREGASGYHKYHACRVINPEDMGDLTKKIPKELKAYYTSYLSFVTNQSTMHSDTAASVLEANASDITAQQDWENEWNGQGLASRLSEKDYKAKKRQKIDKRISDQLRQAVQRSKASTGVTDAQDLMAVLNSITNRSGGAGKTKGSRFTHTEKLQFAKDEEKTMAQLGEGPRADTEEELQQKREEELENLKEDLNEISSRLDKIDLQVKKFTAGIKQMEETIDIETKQYSEKEDAFRVKKRTLDLLPDAENNIAKLQAVVESSAQRLINLANQWEKHRAPLIDQYRELKGLNSEKETDAERMLAEIKIFREKMKHVADEARNKDELYKQLVSEYDRMKKDVSRSANTRRIMEIVANIKKQKHEIDKVLVDTRAIQKEINQLSGKLDRTFTVTDELIFKDAKKDESVRKAYKFLAALHENCDLLIRTVEDTGGIMREIRDLEDQIENESNKRVLANLERITVDYQQMKKENASLIAKIKK